MGKIIRQSIVMLVALTAITGVVYPLVVTGLAQGLFSQAANGSVIERDGKVLGSAVIGQAFSNPKYFWSRPSATSPYADNPAASSGSNLGPTNPSLADAVKQRIDALRAADPGNSAPVPVDLVTSSGSGLDPHISPAAARFQLARVARARGVSEDHVSSLLAQATEGRQLGVLGEPRVNVLKLNLMLDGKGAP
jgi:K+-transporting ATPase ATPase C chain